MSISYLGLFISTFYNLSHFFYIRLPNRNFQKGLPNSFPIVFTFLFSMNIIDISIVFI